MRVRQDVTPSPAHVPHPRRPRERPHAPALWSECATGPRPLSDAELDASIAGVLSGARDDADIWVFAYGSLIWNPLFHYAERRQATLRGFHRRFCLWSMMGRGTPESPGLVLGLDLGGACCGLAYRLPAGKAAEELRLLWRREMVVGSYAPRWARNEAAPCDGSHGCAEELRALAFVVNPFTDKFGFEPAVEPFIPSARSQKGS